MEDGREKLRRALDTFGAAIEEGPKEPHEPRDPVGIAIEAVQHVQGELGQFWNIDGAYAYARGLAGSISPKDWTLVKERIAEEDRRRRQDNRHAA